MSLAEYLQCSILRIPINEKRQGFCGSIEVTVARDV